MTAGKKKSSPSLRVLVLLAFLILLLPLSTLCLLKWNEEQSCAGVESQLKQIGELTTVTRLYRSVFYTREKKNFIQDKSILFTAEFSVQAGIDLSEGYELSVRRGEALLVLPPGRIFIVDADDTSFRQIFVREKFSSVHTGDFLPLIAREADSIEEQALEQGLPREAEEKAVLLMKGILEAAGFDTVHIRFRDRGTL